MIFPYRGEHYKMMRLKCVGDLGQVRVTKLYTFDVGKQKNKNKKLCYLQSPQALQSFSTYHTISHILSSNNRLKKYVSVM